MRSPGAVGFRRAGKAPARTGCHRYRATPATFVHLGSRGRLLGRVSRQACETVVMHSGLGDPRAAIGLRQRDVLVCLVGVTLSQREEYPRVPDARPACLAFAARASSSFRSRLRCSRSSLEPSSVFRRSRGHAARQLLVIGGELTHRGRRLRIQILRGACSARSCRCPDSDSGFRRSSETSRCAASLRLRTDPRVRRNERRDVRCPAGSARATSCRTSRLFSSPVGFSCAATFPAKASTAAAAIAKGRR